MPSVHIPCPKCGDCHWYQLDDTDSGDISSELEEITDMEEISKKLKEGENKVIIKIIEEKKNKEWENMLEQELSVIPNKEEEEVIKRLRNILDREIKKVNKKIKEGQLKGG